MSNDEQGISNDEVRNVPLTSQGIVEISTTNGCDYRLAVGRKGQALPTCSCATHVPRLTSSLEIPCSTFDGSKLKLTTMIQPQRR